MINIRSSETPLTYSWHTVLPSTTNLVLDDPAVYLDHDSLQCYIHGGKCDVRGDGHTPKKMSGDLIQIDLSRFLISYSKVGDPPGGVGGSFATAALKSKLTEAEISAVHVLYADNTLPKSLLNPSEADSRITSTQPILRHSHILFRYGTFLALHGGRDENGMICNNLLAFHLISRCWEDIQNIYGGDAPPRMYGHAVASIHAAKGLFLVMGVECNPNGTFMPSHKRSREEALGTRCSKAVMGRPPNARRSALSIYTLRLEDRLEGWRKVGVSDVATHGPCARVYFSMNIPDSNFTSACDENADLTEGSSIGRVAYLAGGKIGSTYLVDVWRYDLTTRQWREVVLPQHPACDLALSPCLAGQLPQTRDRLAVGRDRRVKPYVVRLVPLIYCSTRRSALSNADGSYREPFNETGKHPWCMSFLLRASRREASQNWSSSPLSSLFALHKMDGSEDNLQVGLSPAGVPALSTVPVARCSKLSMALATFLAVDSDAASWLFYLGRDRKVDAVRVQGLL